MSDNENHRFELLDLIDPNELNSIAKALAEETGLAVGVVRMPIKGEAVPKEPVQFHEWRLTPVFNQSRWCQRIREFSCTDRECMWSDLDFANKAFEKDKTIPYRCLTCHLTDIVAPISACRQHVANIYIGQARSLEASVEECFNKITKLFERDKVEVPPSLKDEMAPYFRELPILKEEKEKSVRTLLKNTSILISQSANRHAVLKVVENISNGIAKSTKQNSLDIFMDELKKLLPYDSGSIWLITHTKRGRVLQSRIVRWHETSLSIEIALEEGKGLVTYVASRALSGEKDPGIMCKTRAEMDSLKPSAVEDSREKRNLQSIVIIPIRYGEECIGVLELGSKQTNFFSINDKHLLQCISSYAGILLKIPGVHDALLEILSQADVKSVIKAIVKGLTELVTGTGVSVFLRYGVDPDSPAVLAESTEIPTLSNKAFYEPGFGLTGWVLKTGIILNIPSGPGARTSERLSKIDPKLKWQGKYASEDRLGINYAEKAFLGVPVRTTDGEVVGVIRVGGRMVGDFTEDDVKTTLVCADHIGAAVGSQGMRTLMLNLMREVRELRTEEATGRREILNAIRYAPHEFIMLLSKAMIIALGASLVLYYTFGFRSIEPSFAWFGCFAFVVYGSMGWIIQLNHQKALGKRNSKKTES